MRTEYFRFLLPALLAAIPVAAEAQSISAPTALTAIAYSKTQIDVAWIDPSRTVIPNADAAPGGTGALDSGYVIERLDSGPGSPWTKVFTAGINSRAWSNTGLLTGASYSYRVRAFSLVGGQPVYSAYSPVAVGTTQSSLYPDPPTNLSISDVSATQVSLKWKDDTKNAIGYKVFRAPSVLGPWTYIGGSSKTSYVDSSAAPGTFYAYAVKVTNSVGDSSPSGIVSATTTKLALPPPPPAAAADTTPPAGSLTINNGALYTRVLAITLNLTASDSVGVTGYYVSTNETPPSPTASGWTSTNSAVNFSGNLGYTLAAGDGMKTFHAWFKDAAGNVSITASASILLDRTIPSNGTMTATPGNAQVMLSWSGFADAGSGLATGTYKLYYSATGNPADTGYSAACNGTPLYTGSATSFSHTGLTNGTTYYYRVCVSDKAGNIATGATATATPTGSVDTTAPTGSVVINGGAPYSASTTVTLTLNATDAVAVTGYWLSLGTSTPSASAPGWNAITPTSSYSANISYTFAFTADGPKTVYVWYKDAAGNVSAMTSASMILDRTPPYNGSLSATPGLGRITLTWSNFSDSGSGLDNTLPYTLVYSAAATPASCSSGGGVSTLYTGANTTFTHNTTSGPLYYRVCATDKVGNIDTGATASATPLTNTPPVANAGPDQKGTAGVAIYFDGSGSSDPDGTIASYKYAFGDGLSITSPNAGVVGHAYSSPGTYTMTLTVTDNAGATGTDTALVTVVGASPSQGNFRWARPIGGRDSDQGNSVTVDGSGNGIVVGNFQGTAYFGGPQPLTSTGGSTDIFIAKYSPSGAYICARQVGGTGDDRALTAKADASGNIFVTGTFAGTVDFGGTVLTSSAGSGDVFVAKYAPDCTSLLWVKGFGSSTDDVGYGLAVDGYGDVIVTGYFSGSANFGGGTVLSNGPFADIFIAKYSGSNGAYQWAHTLYGPSIDIGRSAAVDRDGNVVVTGSFQSTVSDGETFQPMMTSAGSVDFFLLKYSSAGAYLWSRAFGGSGDDVAYGVDVDDGDNIAVVGSFQMTMALGGNSLTSAGLSDTFVAKFSPLGNHLWSLRVGGTGIDIDYAVAVDGVGNVVLTGGYQYTSGQWDVLVAKYSAAGAPLWSRNYGSTANDLGLGVAVDGGGNVLVTGYFQGAINFGGGPLTSAGMTDGFLLNLGP
jgi:hypothetical protein